MGHVLICPLASLTEILTLDSYNVLPSKIVTFQ